MMIISSLFPLGATPLFLTMPRPKLPHRYKPGQHYIFIVGQPSEMAPTVRLSLALPLALALSLTLTLTLALAQLLAAVFQYFSL